MSLYLFTFIGLQPPTVASLLSGGAGAAPQSTSNILLQALMNQQAAPAPAPAAPVVAPVAPAPAGNTAALTQLAQLLQGGGIDPNALVALLAPQQPETQATPASSSVSKPNGSYSTSYPSYNYSNSQASNYGPSKDDDAKHSYRPY